MKRITTKDSIFNLKENATFTAYPLSDYEGD